MQYRARSPQYNVVALQTVDSQCRIGIHNKYPAVKVSAYQWKIYIIGFYPIIK